MFFHFFSARRNVDDNGMKSANPSGQSPDNIKDTDQRSTKFSRLYFSSDLRGGMNRFPIIEHNLQKVRGAAMEAAFQDAEKLEKFFGNDSKDNVIVKGSAIGEMLHVWPLPQYLILKKYADDLSHKARKSLVRLDKSKGLNIMFIFADESESRQTVDASTEILSSTLEFPSRASCQSKSSEVDYSGIDILDTLIIERLAESTFLEKLRSTGDDDILLSSSSPPSSRFRSSAGAGLNLKASDPVFDKQEYYRLTLNGNLAKIEAVTHAGVLHGVRTFSNLLNTYSGRKILHCPVLTLNPIKILDYPRFLHRGFLIDSAHHYKSVEFLKRLIFSMGLMKMNTLHWHLTDHQNFAIEVPGEFTSKFTASQDADTYYNMTDVQAIVEYGRKMGVHVLIEIDIPGHALAWEKAYSNMVNVYCKNPISAPRTFPNCNANLDPTIENTYFMLKKLFGNLKKYLPSVNKLLHLGGDEVSFNTWKWSNKLNTWANNVGRVTLEKYDIAHTHPDGSLLDIPHRLLELFEKRLDEIIKFVFSPDTVIIRWEEIFKPHLFKCCYFPRENIVV